MTTAFTPGCPHHAALAPLASRLVDPDTIHWRPTRFRGIHVKPLLQDPTTGLSSAIVRMDPGAELPDHEHVRIEQTWVIEGHLVDRAGPDAGIECKAGQFIWRPAGSRHSAWSPNGGTFLAFFQMPNKFMDTPGRISDMAGADWEQAWGHAVPG